MMDTEQRGSISDGSTLPKHENLKAGESRLEGKLEHMMFSGTYESDVLRICVAHMRNREKSVPIKAAATQVIKMMGGQL